jgi:hypothetical protein
MKLHVISGWIAADRFGFDLQLSAVALCKQ